MLSSVRARLIVLLLGFLLLITGSVVATFVGLQTMAQDATVIHVAGRQRMLLQQTIRHALEIEEGVDHALEMQYSMSLFEYTLRALTEGGQALHVDDRVVDVPATRDPVILESLRQLQRNWRAYRQHLDVIVRADPAGTEFQLAMQLLKRLSPYLVQQADGIVGMYEAASEQKLMRLRRIQAAFFGSALLLLAIGAWVTQKSVIEPLRSLGSVAERIGAGDLDTPVEGAGPREIELLARRIDGMRTQLRTSQVELTAWTEELAVRVAQRTRELAALHEVSRSISSRLDLDHVLRSVTARARELLAGQVATLCLLDEADPVLHVQAVSGPPQALIGTTVRVDRSPGSRVLAGDRALSCGMDGCTEACRIIAGPFRASHLAAPLRVGDRVIGALCVGSSVAGTFAADDANLLTRLASSAAIALENARLYQQAERVATLEERQRIAADMHDGLAQTLSYLHLQVDEVTEEIAASKNSEALTSLERIRETLIEAVEEVRANIAGLSGLPTPPQALHRLLASAVQEARDAHQAELLVTAPELEDLEVAPDVAEQIRRIVQEALANACRHGHAHQVQVQLGATNGDVVIAVEDDGCGFEPGQAPADERHHFGLSTMRARAARIGGRLDVDSRPGHGTRVVLHWPPSETARKERNQ